MSKQYYVEKRAFGNILYREVVEGTDEMLNAYPEKNALVEIRNLDIVYGSGAKSFPAIKDLNLNIYDGEVLGLVGESGSGKSTTGRAIIGLTPYEFGQIKILDRVVPKNIDKGWKFSKKYKDTINFMVNKVQMIFQDPTNSLNPFKNVEYVVGEGLSNTKNAKLIYLTDFDEATFMAINSLIQLKDPENIIYDSPLKKYQEEGETIESSYNFVFVEFVKLLEQRASEKPEIYDDIYKKILVEKEERDKMSSLSEKQCKRLLVIDILKQVGLDDTVLGRFPLEFSGGQQQRLGICRAVVLRPKLLIADEPISALDVSIQAQVINIFNDLKEKYHLTILFIAHDLRMVEYISDRIAVINRGTLLEIGPTDEIINNPYHPYTKSLLDAVPSIEKEKGSLMGKIYDHKIHNYTEEYQPKWHNVGNKHFVLATAAEIEQYKLETVTKERP